MLRAVEWVTSAGDPLAPTPGRRALAEAFPALSFCEVAAPSEGAVWIDLAAFRDPAIDFWRFDTWMEQALEGGPGTIALTGGRADGDDEALQLVTRCQRLTSTRNVASCTPQFDAVLAAHASLFDCEKPLVLADYRHALDTWQWTLRLDRSASAALQIAALFHDIERLVSEADARIEQHAPDYRAFKERHAIKGAAMLRAALRPADCDDAIVDAAAKLVARHETAAVEGDVSLLNDADALSFFSLNSPGFHDYYGREHTRKKVDYTLARMRPSALAYLTTLRLRADVASVVSELRRDRRYGSAA